MALAVEGMIFARWIGPWMTATFGLIHGLTSLALTVLIMGLLITGAMVATKFALSLLFSDP
jgi:hypothetical protein